VLEEDINPAYELFCGKVKKADTAKGLVEMAPSSFNMTIDSKQG
jgi:hypothetical protein